MKKSINKIVEEIKNFLPKGVIATPKQIKRAIIYHNNFLRNYPEKNVIYFLGEDTKSYNDFVLKQLSSILYYDFCHAKDAYGSYEILRLLLKKEVPENIVMFYMKNRNGGFSALEIISLRYGIGDSYFKTIEDVCEDLISTFPDHTKDISDAFDGFIDKYTISEIKMRIQNKISY